MKSALSFMCLVLGLLFGVGVSAEEKDKIQEESRKEEKPFRQPFKLAVPLKDKTNEKPEIEVDEKEKKDSLKKG